MLNKIPGIFIDIDGVLKLGSVPIPKAKEGIELLRKFKIPFTLVTNDGGDLESVKANKYTKILGLNREYSFKENEVVYDLGIPINPELDPDETENIRIVTLIEHTVLSGMHYGSLDNIQETYNIMAEYSIENKYDIIGSPKEIYIKNKFEVENEDDMVTEIQLPVIKMG